MHSGAVTPPPGVSLAAFLLPLLPTAALCARRWFRSKGEKLPPQPGRRGGQVLDVQG